MLCRVPRIYTETVFDSPAIFTDRIVPDITRAASLEAIVSAHIAT